jgi:uncharacterized protein YbaP (TraB family)
MLYHYALLNAEQMKTLTGLEQELGKTLVAFQGQDIPPDQLTPEQLKRIEQVESEMGLSLVAVAS